MRLPEPEITTSLSWRSMSQSLGWNLVAYLPMTTETSTPISSRNASRASGSVTPAARAVISTFTPSSPFRIHASRSTPDRVTKATAARTVVWFDDRRFECTERVWVVV